MTRWLSFFVLNEVLCWIHLALVTPVGTEVSVMAHLYQLALTGHFAWHATEKTDFFFPLPVTSMALIFRQWRKTLALERYSELEARRFQKDRKVFCKRDESVCSSGIFLSAPVVLWGLPLPSPTAAGAVPRERRKGTPPVSQCAFLLSSFP